MDIQSISQIFPIKQLFKIRRDKNKQKQAEVPSESQQDQPKKNETKTDQHIDEVV